MENRTFLLSYVTEDVLRRTIGVYTPTVAMKAIGVYTPTVATKLFLGLNEAIIQ
jgi:hypothetical protein